MSKPDLSTAEQIGSMVSNGLIELLSKVFPVKNPKPGSCNETRLFEAGNAEVVLYLRECQKQARAL